MMQEHRTTINENGRLVIPAAYRKALDIQPGEEIILRLENNELRISTIKQALQRARQLVKQHINPDISLVESLLSERLKEAKNE